MIKNYRSDRCFIIAEISANHNKDIEIAKKLIVSAKKSGADAVKLQTYTPDTLTIDCNSDIFKVGKDTLWSGESFYSLYKKAYTPWEWHKELFEEAKKNNIICFSTPFDKTAIDFLEEINNPIYKVASFEMTDIPLIKYIASKGKPIIMSTGISTLDEIEEAVNACREMGNNKITLLKCTSSYPAPYEEMNIITIQDMKKRFNCEVGLSDHTLGIEVAIAAAALGAKVIEKHITLDKNEKGPDSEFSMEPDEFKSMVKSIRNVEKAIGKVDYSLNDIKIKNRKFARSLFVVKDIKKGEKFTENNIRSIRPSDGLHPRYYEEILGKKSTVDIEFGTPLSWDYIEI